MSLFSYQGSLFFRCSSATFISYHVRFNLSRTFLTFLKSFCSLELLSSISAAAPCDVDYHITPSAECQHLFLKFFIFFKLLIQLCYCIYNLLKINFLIIRPFFLLLMALCQEFKDQPFGIQLFYEIQKQYQQG